MSVCDVSMKARADISAKGFWCRGLKAFFDVRIFDTKAQSHENKTLKRCYELNEPKKKRDYNCRILSVKQGSFTPLIFSITDGMGREYSMFAKRLCQLIATKRKESLRREFCAKSVMQ